MHIITMTKNELEKHITQSAIHENIVQTAVGWLLVHATGRGVFKAEFIETSQAKKYQRINLNEIDTLLIAGSPLQVKVWQTLTGYPREYTYKKLAEKIGHPKAYRAIGNALAANKIAYFIPCHKVIRNDGSLGGYKWGIDRKKLLLENPQRDLARL